jgi:hypothetical protein
MIVAVIILSFVAVCGFLGYAVGGATILERHLRRRADARALATSSNVAPIDRGLSASVARHPSGRS